MALAFIEAFAVADLGGTSVIPSLSLFLGIYRDEVLNKSFSGCLSTGLNLVFEYVVFISTVLYLQKREFKALTEQPLPPAVRTGFPFWSRILHEINKSCAFAEYGVTQKLKDSCRVKQWAGLFEVFSHATKHSL